MKSVRLNFLKKTLLSFVIMDQPRHLQSQSSWLTETLPFADIRNFSIVSRNSQRATRSRQLVATRGARRAMSHFHVARGLHTNPSISTTSASRSSPRRVRCHNHTLPQQPRNATPKPRSYTRFSPASLGSRVTGRKGGKAAGSGVFISPVYRVLSFRDWNLYLLTIKWFAT